MAQAIGGIHLAYNFTMPYSTLDFGNLSLLIFVIILSCCVSTLLSCWLMRSISPHTYQYCASCAHQLGVLSFTQTVITDGIVARPVQGHAGTSQRLGMQTTRPVMGLEVGHLQTRPLSPTPADEVESRNDELKAEDNIKYNEVMRKSSKHCQVSPESAEVISRKDTVQSFPVGYRMSRRTLVFPSQSEQSVDLILREKEGKEYSTASSLANTIVGGEEENLIGKNTNQRQVVRRSINARKEKFKLILLRRQEDAGLTSQSEDKRGGAGFRQNSKPSRVANQVGKRAVVDGFNNPGYDGTSDANKEMSGPGYQNLPSIHFSPRSREGND